MIGRNLQPKPDPSPIVISIRELLAEHAAHSPQAEALSAPGRMPLNYQGLLRQVDSVIQALRSWGLSRRDRVALVLPNGPDMAVAFLGIAAGAACAPLNQIYQEKEFEFYLADLGVKALVVQAGMESPAWEVARRLGVPLIELHPSEEAGVFRLTEGRETPSSGTDPGGPEDEALVLHTSGTTARPKIVSLTQANLCISARNIVKSLELTHQDRSLNIMPLFHVHGLMASVLATLVAGGCVVCTPGFRAPRFFGWLAEFRPTWYTAVPTMHQAILARAPANLEVIKACQLRFIRSSSAPLPPPVMNELEQVFKAPAVEAYGMTEASHQIACNPLPPQARKPGSVGLPTGCRVAVMGEQGHLLQPGQTGEIGIQGDSVTSGYENNPEANESAFINGWFRTGDQGYLDAEGYVFITGRLKELINRGGEKISPREVEEVMLAHPSVAEATTFAMPSAQLGEDVAAAVVLRPGAKVGENELRGFVAESLAHFKVPRRVLFLDELPKGPTGKLQRTGLAERLGLGPDEFEPPEGADRHVAPQSEHEKQLAALFSQVLGLEEVGAEDNFFLAGGDSMLAVQLVARVQETLGIRLPLAYLFIAPTVRKLAVAIANGELPEEWSALVPIQPGGTKPPFFCFPPHHGQVIVYYDLAHHLGPDQPIYSFQAVGPEGEMKLPDSLEKLATSYAAEIVAIQPEGPYYLGGYCSGAPLAFEVARQIVNMGRKVALLTLMDAYAPGHPKPLPKRTALSGLISNAIDYLHRVRNFFQFLSWLTPRQRLAHLFHLPTNLLKQVLRASFLVQGRSLPQFLQPEEGSLQALLQGFRPQVYPGRAILFRPTKEPLGFQRDPLMGWGTLVADGLEVVEVPGYYRTLIFKPRSRTLAGLLQERLEIAQKKEGWE